MNQNKPSCMQAVQSILIIIMIGAMFVGLVLWIVSGDVGWFTGGLMAGIGGAFWAYSLRRERDKSLRMPCPECAEPILREARRCPHCQQSISPRGTGISSRRL